jgi:hypothetical protein
VWSMLIAAAVLVPGIWDPLVQHAAA